MHPLTEAEIRGAFVNATEQDLRVMAMPLSFMLTEWDYREVQSFEALAALWDTVATRDPLELALEHAQALTVTLDLNAVLLDAEQSRFFKHHYRSNWHNRGIMVREGRVA